MWATEFARDSCRVGHNRRTYAELRREWRCNACGGRVVLYPPSEDIPSWHVLCGRCKGRDFIHERQLQQEAQDAVEAIEGLPDYLQPPTKKLAREYLRRVMESEKGKI